MSFFRGDYIDMNNLKYINTFSHATGDKAIEAVVHFLDDLVKTEPYAVTARLKTAGDEFGIVSIFQNEASQVQFYEKLKKPLEISRSKTKTISITLSAGVSFCDCSDPVEFSSIMDHADKVLEKVKNTIPCDIKTKQGTEYRVKSRSDFKTARFPKDKKKPVNGAS